MKSCFQSLQKLPAEEEKKDIAKMFENVSSEEMDYEEFLEAIDAYRRKILSGAGEETLSAGENR